MSKLNQLIKEEAKRLGFSLVGVTTPDPPPHLPVYDYWLSMGRHGEMEYLAREQARLRRGDPKEILPECLSILVLGIRYPSPKANNPENIPGLNGLVASYAWGDDYHIVLPERLQALVAYIETQVGRPVPNRWYTDTGPILERDMAQRAGLGWIGKNTCLIHPRHGSYFLLAEILLGIELQPDQPITTDHCGTCTRCIQACPTQCILPDRTIDARRCISYLTIELKNEIPEDLRPAIGNWVFGCDICQMVCPWNQRFAENEGVDAFAPRPDVPAPDLIHDMTLSSDEFNRKFKNSPVKRAKHRGYLRNVAVALGNSGDSTAIPVLENALKDSDPLISEHVEWALKQIKSK